MNVSAESAMMSAFAYFRVDFGGALHLVHQFALGLGSLYNHSESPRGGLVCE